MEKHQSIGQIPLWEDLGNDPHHGVKNHGQTWHVRAGKPPKLGSESLLASGAGKEAKVGAHVEKGGKKADEYKSSGVAMPPRRRHGPAVGISDGFGYPESNWYGGVIGLIPVTSFCPTTINSFSLGSIDLAQPKMARTRCPRWYDPKQQHRVMLRVSINRTHVTADGRVSNEHDVSTAGCRTLGVTK